MGSNCSYITSKLLQSNCRRELYSLPAILGLVATGVVHKSNWGSWELLLMCSVCQIYIDSKLRQSKNRE